jgi:hypothetical protein
VISLYWAWWIFVSGLAFAAVQGCLTFTLPHPWDEDGGEQ